ncbi:MAG: glucokinase [Alphaproteobacteria bacterium]|nr:glucokinase [Alphaproteobacteria bacterium]MDE2496147.1 glucokinase [Alphaproteobacteria bacterium]
MRSSGGYELVLVGDLGGTNARLGIASFDRGRPVLRSCTTLSASDFRAPEDLIAAYLACLSLPSPPWAAVLAAAGPVARGCVFFTNLNWHISEDVLARKFGLERALLVNDFVALAKSIPALASNDVTIIGPELDGTPGEAVAVLGPGTGFGVSAIVTRDGHETVLPTEGGHLPFAPRYEVEIVVWRALCERFNRVSIERILSGPGLLNLYSTLCRIDGKIPVFSDPGQITSAAEEGDELAARTVDEFCAILGSVAGDIALSLGARGGVLIGGGMAPRLLGRLQSGAFRKSFEAKGRLEAYVKGIPTRVIVQPYATLLGAARILMHDRTSVEANRVPASR